MPWWIGVLEAAEAWGCAPWEIAPGGKFLWYSRWVSYTNTVNKAIRERRERESRKQTSRGRR